VYGTYSASAPGDSISIRYATKSSDGILNCSGNSNSTGAIGGYVNTFSVIVTGTVSQLVCNMNGTNYPLVNGVQNLSVLYGINSAGTAANVDTYLTASQVNAAVAWNKVISVYITLTFNNPLYVTANAGQPQYLSISRNVAVMNQVGL
jgi:type IV pilus assembly protein PilW